MAAALFGSGKTIRRLTRATAIRCASSHSLRIATRDDSNIPYRHQSSPLLASPPTAAATTIRRKQHNESGGRRSTRLRCNLSLATARTFSSSGDDDKGENANKDLTSTTKTSIVPGLGLSVATAASGFSAAAYLSSATGLAGISGIPCSLLLGMLVRNTLLTTNKPDHYFQTIFKPGVTVATKTVLQTGIVCVAAKLSVTDVMSTGMHSLPVVVAAMTSGLLYIPAAGKALGLPTKQSLLLAAGTSVCGVTAITALAPALKAPPRDVAVAVANTVAFGTVGMLLYPSVFHEVCMASSEQAGMCLGVAIHDTSQVLGSALAYKETYGDTVAFEVAAVTKLLRNVGLAVVLPTLTYVYHKEQDRQNKEQEQSGVDASNGTATSTNSEGKTPKGPETVSGLATFTKYVPPFLIAFLGMSAVRSLGDIAIVPSVLGDDANDLYLNYRAAMNFIGNDLSKAALGTAMAGVGLSTQTSTLKGVGWKPFAVGGSGALVVGGTGFAVATAATTTMV